MASNFSIPGQIDCAHASFTESRSIADITEINMPLAKKFWIISWSRPSLSLTMCQSTSKVLSTGRGDIGIAGRGGVAVHLDLQHLGVLHELQVGHAHGVHRLFAVQTFDRLARAP